MQTPFLNLDPFQQWYGIENVAKVKVNGESCMALLDNCTQVNTIMSRYVSNHSLQGGPITDLMGSKVAFVGLGNVYTRPLGYVVIQDQVDRVQDYNKDQIALVIPDFSNPWEAHYWPSSQCNERGGDGCLSDTMGKC